MKRPKPHIIRNLPFDASDIEQMERDRIRMEAKLDNQSRRELCHGCAEDKPVTRMEPIGKTGMYYLIHRGSKAWGAMWCQCPHLHPANRTPTLTEAIGDHEEAEILLEPSVRSTDVRRDLDLSSPEAVERFMAANPAGTDRLVQAVLNAPERTERKEP